MGAEETMTIPYQSRATRVRIPLLVGVVAGQTVVAGRSSVETHGVAIAAGVLFPEGRNVGRSGPHPRLSRLLHTALASAAESGRAAVEPRPCPARLPRRVA